MNEITKTNKDKAYELNSRILACANAAYSSLMESAKLLKEMRDTKLYIEMGYESFEDYTVAELGIHERQAYTYIKPYEELGERFLQSNANLGITKLALIAQLPSVDREEFTENNDLAGMTVEQVKQLVKENDAKGEQLELLTDERDAIKEERDEAVQDAAAAEERIAELEKELEAERNKPVPVAVAEPDPAEIQKIKDAAAASAKKAAEKELKAVKKELEDKHKKELASADEKAKADREKAVAEIKQKLSEIDAAKAEAVKRAEQLEKQLVVSSSAETVKFKFYFDALDENFKNITESLKKLFEESPDTAAKFKNACYGALDIMKKSLDGIKS